MKLFKSLLVAPATLGLLAPMSATANEVTISDFAPAEELAVTNSRVDGLEARLNDFEAGSFSSTTTAAFSADMAIGGVEGNTVTEALVTDYGYQIDLTTSFTGEDTFAVAIDAGSAAGALAELDLNGSPAGNDALSVDGITYTFPVGEKLTFLVGDSTSGSALFSTACVYGGFTNTLDDCGNAASAITATGHATLVAGTVGFSAAYDIGNGFTGAFGYNGQGSDGAGLGTTEGLDFYAGQLTYTGDSYGASVTYSNLDFATFWGLNGYYTFSENLPSISVGYEFGEVETQLVGNQQFNESDTTQWFVGLQWDEIGNGSLGVAMGSRGAQAENVEENMAYELFYTYNVNDNMTITPAIFVLEENQQANVDDQTGVVVKTSFSF